MTNKQEYITGIELAKRMGITRGRITQLKNKGVIPFKLQGKNPVYAWPECEVILNERHHVVSAPKELLPIVEAPKVAVKLHDQTEERLSSLALKNRTEIAKAEERELKVAEARGKVVSKKLLEEVFTPILEQLQQRLSNRSQDTAKTLALSLVGKQNIMEDAALLEKEIIKVSYPVDQEIQQILAKAYDSIGFSVEYA